MIERRHPTKRQYALIARLRWAVKCLIRPTAGAILISEDAYLALRDWASWKCSHGVSPWPVRNPDPENSFPCFYHVTVICDESLSGAEVILQAELPPPPARSSTEQGARGRASGRGDKGPTHGRPRQPRERVVVALSS